MIGYHKKLYKKGAKPVLAGDGRLSVFVAVLALLLLVSTADAAAPASPSSSCVCTSLREVQAEAEAGFMKVSQSVSKTLMPDPQLETGLSGCLSGLQSFSLGSLFSFGLPSLSSIVTSVCNRFTDAINSYVENNLNNLIGSGSHGVKALGGLFTAEFGTSVSGDDPNVFIDNPAVTTSDTSDTAVNAIWSIIQP